MTPTIDIHYSAYLDNIFAAFVRSIPAYSDWQRPDVKSVKAKTMVFQDIWQKRGENIIRSICKTTGLSFKRNYFPVYVVCGNTRAYSNPIAIKSRFSPSEFIECLTPEVIPG
jgi:hypothetical protein